MSVYQASATATEYHCLLRVQYHLLHLCLEHSLKLLDGVSPALSTELVLALRSVSSAFSTTASIDYRELRALPIFNHLFHILLVISLMSHSYSNPYPSPNLFCSSSDYPQPMPSPISPDTNRIAYLSRPGKVPKRSRDGENVGERQECGSSSPAEVLVALDVHVCIVNQPSVPTVSIAREIHTGVPN